MSKRNLDSILDSPINPNETKQDAQNTDLDSILDSPINPNKTTNSNKTKQQAPIQPPPPPIEPPIKKQKQIKEFSISFGNDQSHINSLFNGFTSFQYLTRFPKVLSSGVNGKVLLCEYENQGYTKNTVLKITKDNTSDNLLYEYFIGITVVDDLCRFFPCFLKTYGLYKIINEYGQQLKNNKKKTDMNILKEGLELLPISSDNDIQEHIDESCFDLTDIVIMTEYTKGIRFDELFESNKNDPYFLNVELPNILLQIYLPLSSIQHIFIHNDLHFKNVIVQKLPENKYIEFKYYRNSYKTIKTQYIVKIIDYGRAYTPTFEEYYDKMCKAQNCLVDDRYCGETKGYKYILRNYFEAIRRPNQNKRDLRFIHHIKEIDDDENIFPHSNEMKELLSKIHYDKKCIQGKICNVNDLVFSLAFLIKSNDYIENIRNTSYESIGILEIDLTANNKLNFIHPTNSTNSTNSTHAIHLTNHTNHTNSTHATHLTNHTNHTHPTYLTNHTNHTNHTNTTSPTNPTNPTNTNSIWKWPWVSGGHKTKRRKRKHRKSKKTKSVRH